MAELSLGFEAMQLTTDNRLTLIACTAEPNSTSAEALGLLAGWAATESSAQIQLRIR